MKALVVLGIVVLAAVYGASRIMLKASAAEFRRSVHDCIEPHHAAEQMTACAASVADRYQVVIVPGTLKIETSDPLNGAVVGGVIQVRKAKVTIRGDYSMKRMLAKMADHFEISKEILVESRVKGAVPAGGQ